MYQDWMENIPVIGDIEIKGGKPMTDEEKKEFSGGVELSLDISNETMQNLKEALGTNELEQIHKRFENGTETIEDIMYSCLNYGLDFENGKQLRVVETKYFDKLVKHIEKQSKIIQAMAGDIFIEIIKPDGQHFATEEEVIKFYKKVVGE